MAKCLIYWDKDIQAYHMKMPYMAKLIEFLKRQIPHSNRQFDETTKVWTFTEEYLDGTVAFAKLCFGNSEVAITTREMVERTSTPIIASRSPIGDVCYQFMKAIPYEAARKAYREAAVRLHPDQGGDMAVMSNVNALWTKIEKEVYGQ